MDTTIRTLRKARISTCSSFLPEASTRSWRTLSDEVMPQEDLEVARLTKS